MLKTQHRGLRIETKVNLYALPEKTKMDDHPQNGHTDPQNTDPNQAF